MVLRTHNLSLKTGWLIWDIYGAPIPKRQLGASMNYSWLEYSIGTTVMLGFCQYIAESVEGQMEYLAEQQLFQEYDE
jgi:hypothetical protein